MSDSLTLLELEERAGVPDGVLLEWIELGWLCPLEGGAVRERWRFSGESLARVRSLLRLARELDLAPDVAVLVQGLIEDRRRAERRLEGLLRLLGASR